MGIMKRNGARTCFRRLTVVTIAAALIPIISQHTVAVQVDEAAIAHLVREFERGTNRSMDAARELARIGKPAVPAVIAALKHSSGEVRMWAMVALRKMGPVDPSIMPALIEALGRVSGAPGWSVPFADEEGYALALALYAMGPEVRPHMIAALDHEEPNARATAALTLAQFAEPYYEVLGEEDVERPDPISLDEATIQKMLELADDPSGPVRYAALINLSMIGSDSPQSAAILPLLVKRVDDPAEMVRGAAAIAILPYGDRAAHALPVLMKWFKNHPNTYRVDQRVFGEAIGAMGAAAAPAVPMLIEASKSPKPWVREEAVYALGLIGPDVEGVLPALQEALEDPENSVRRQAENALKPPVGSEMAELIEALRSPDPSVVGAAVGALRGRGAEAAPATEALIAQLGDDKGKVDLSILWLLREIGEPAIPTLVEALGHENAGVRRGAAELLGSFGRPAANAADRLAALHQTDPDPDVRRLAALALASTRPGDEVGLTALIEILAKPMTDPSYDSRPFAVAHTTALALGRWQTPEAVEALLEAQKRINAKHVGVGQSFRSSLVKPLIEAGPVAIAALIDGLAREVIASEVVAVLGGLGGAAVPALIKALESDNAARRAGAAASLKILAEKQRREARPAIPTLIGALEDDDAQVRKAVARALGAFGPEAEAGKAGLVQLLEDPDMDMSAAAAYALCDMPPAAEAMLPTLFQWISGEDKRARYVAGEVVKRLGDDAVPSLLAALRSDDPARRLEASLALTYLDFDVTRGNARQLVGPLVETLSDEEPVAIHAAKVLDEIARLGGRGAGADELIPLVDHEAVHTRRAAVGLLRYKGREAVPALLRATEDPDSEVRARASTSLGGDEYRPRNLSKEALAALLDAAKAPEAPVRAAAVAALGNTTGRGSAGLFGELRQLFGSVPDPSEVEIEVAKALGEALDDSDLSVRQAATRGLGKMRPTVPGVVDSLMRALGDPNGFVRYQAAKSVAREGTADVPRLLAMLSEDRAEFRMGAAEALAYINNGQNLRPAYGPLVEALEDPSAGVREAVVQAVGSALRTDAEGFEPFAARCCDALSTGWRHEDPKVRRSALAILRELGPKVDRDDTTIPALIAALEDDDSGVRHSAAEALRAYGTRASPALPALREASNDEDWLARSEARRAIEVIAK
jgi:HEAT repeat protein